ncbi:hypothetical protein [Salipaludibacillus sp. CF4.18]|uniref:hypothetical protein n=1 Tax=Salipaludibacillus sp. CF4.18 TaxID=3373081 RepID=UPI003EE647BA
MAKEQNEQTEEIKEQDPQKIKRKTYPSNNAKEVKEKDGVIYFKATKKLTLSEHKALSSRIRHEMEETGLNIVLVPYMVDVDTEDE